MENQSSIKNIIADSLREIRTFIDADTIVGKQIVTQSGVVIIPISKLSMGFASGGVDLPGKKDGTKSFGGGGGTGVTVSPIGFLTISPEGEVSMVPITPEETTPIDQIMGFVEQAPEIIKKIKDAITGQNEELDEEEIIAREEALAEALAAEALKKSEPEVQVELSPKEAKKAAKAEKKAARRAAREARHNELDDENDLL